jgi:hypothetical protein
MRDYRGAKCRRCGLPPAEHKPRPLPWRDEKGSEVPVHGFDLATNN